MLEYLLPDQKPAERSATDLPGGLRPASEQSVSTVITFLDTFDGRLYRRGKVVQAEHSAAGRVDIVLRDFGEPHRERTVAAEPLPLPRFADQLADTALRAELAALIDVRALLPQARVRRERRALCLPDCSEEVPAAIYLDRYRLIGKPKASPALRARLVLDPGESTGRHVRRRLETWADRLELKPAEQDLWLEVLRALQRPRRPGFAVRPPDLQPEMRSDLAVKRLLLAQFEAMRAQEPGLLARWDTEFLHDFRVAVRRSRSALGQLRGLYPERTIAALTRELSWLGNITGPVRDLDVYLLEFPGLQAVLPECMRGDLAPLRRLLERRSIAAHRELSRYLRSSRYRRFTDRWSGFLNRPVPARPGAPNALQPFRMLAGRRIWKLYRRVIEEGRSIGDGTPSESIHELRKRCKKLRYLTEFVALLDPGETSLKRPIKDLKSLQNLLGSFQDAEVQMVHLREWSAELAADPAVPAATLLAVGALIGHFDRRQQEWRGQIAEAAVEFGRKDNRERFRRLLEDAD